MEEMSHINQTSTDMQNLEDLRRCINQKAESMISFTDTKSKKRNLIISIVGMVLLVVFYALNSVQYGSNENLAGRYAFPGVIFLATLLLFSLCIRIQRHYLTVMKESKSPLLHYQAARRYINTSQLNAVILLTGFVAISLSIYGENVRTVVFVSCFIFAALIIWRLFKRDLLVNKDFYNDVEEFGHTDDLTNTV